MFDQQIAWFAVSTWIYHIAWIVLFFLLAWLVHRLAQGMACCRSGACLAPASRIYTIVGMRADGLPESALVAKPSLVDAIGPRDESFAQSRGGYKMSDTCLSQELHGKPIVSVTNGRIIAKVLDVLMDPDRLQLAAVVTSKGGLLSREKDIQVIPSVEVQVWGRDVVLVSRSDVIVKKSELPGSEKWLSVTDRIKGHDVISTDGQRIGKLNDVVVDSRGQLVGYDLVQAFVFKGGPSAGLKQITAGATSSLGQDVLIVDATRIAAVQWDDTVQADEVTQTAEEMPQAETTPQAMEEMPQLEEPAQGLEETGRPEQ
jgi:uncharacterized protein YrrD